MNKIVYECFKYVPNPLKNNGYIKEIHKSKYLFAKEHLIKILYNSIVSGFRQTVYYISDDKGIVHFSVVIGKCKKFQFLGKHDYVIGPCWTRDDYRGRGIYSGIINYIGDLYYKKNNASNIYILIQKENTPSLNGVKKSDFINIGSVEKSKYLKIFSKKITSQDNI